jgi:hypothetical protein
VLALNSKDMAVSLPVALLLYEMLWIVPGLDRNGLLRWAKRESMPIGVSGLMTVAYVLGRILPQGPALGGMAEYALNISTAEYLRKTAHYLDDFFYRSDVLDAPTTALIRSRALVFCILVFLITLLPMAFIPPRGLNAVYLPLAGLAMFAAALAMRVHDALWRWIRRPRWQPASRWLLFAAVAGLLSYVHISNERFYTGVFAEYSQIRTARTRLEQWHAQLPPRSRVLIAQSPFPQYAHFYNSLFLFQLIFRDPTLAVHELAALDPKPRAAGVAGYDYILSFEEHGLVEIDPEDAAAILERETGAEK